jgi:hypothetical protein
MPSDLQVGVTVGAHQVDDFDLLAIGVPGINLHRVFPVFTCPLPIN